MAGAANPLKNFRWVLEVAGVNMFMIQECQIPTVEFPVIEHGAPINLPNAKTPGKMKISELVVKKLRLSVGADNWAWDMMARGLTGLNADYALQGFLVDKGPDGFSTVEKYYLGNFWPSKIDQGNRVMMGDGENLIETVTFAIQYCYPISSPQFTLLFGASGAGAAGAGFISGNG